MAAAMGGGLLIGIERERRKGDRCPARVPEDGCEPMEATRNCGYTAPLLLLLRTEGIRIRAAFELLGADRVHGCDLVKPDVLIELTREYRLEVMTLKLRFRPLPTPPFPRKT